MYEDLFPKLPKYVPLTDQEPVKPVPGLYERGLEAYGAMREEDFLRAERLARERDLSQEWDKDDY